MNLIITSIAMVDLTKKEAKKVFFSENKNLLTSKKNHLGKSVIMKSIYYTLGAEVYFPMPIKSINLLTYIDFKLKKHMYRVSRLNWSFALFCDGKLLEVYDSVNEFSRALNELYELDINLVGKDTLGTITKCPPVFYYLPYYIDQENGWSPTSFSFDRLTQFDLPQRKNSYFFHLGVLDNEYVEQSKCQKANDRQIALLAKESEKYLTVINTLRTGLDDTQLAFDPTTLENAINYRKQEMKKILDEMTKARNDLVEAEDIYMQISHDKEVIAKYIKKKKPQTDELEKDVLECPRCGMSFERTLTQKLEKIYLLESLHDDYVDISNDLIELEKKIAKLRKKFNEKHTLLKNYEKTLANDQEIYNAYLKSKATNQLLKEYEGKIGLNSSEIDRLSKDNAEIRSQLSIYAQKKSQTNQLYLLNMSKLLIDLDIPKNQVEDGSEPGSSLAASGAYGPRCKVAQMLAFLQTQKKISPGIISFPVVIDSPNALEQDKEHLDSVIRTLLTWDKTSNQIIVASIEGKDTAESIPDVKVISLTNPKNHLLSSNEYYLYEEEINEIFTKF